MPALNVQQKHAISDDYSGLHLKIKFVYFFTICHKLLRPGTNSGGQDQITAGQGTNM